VEVLKKYKTKGSFEFQIGDKLVELCKNVPNEPGIYLIYIVKNSIRELVYIGASGKMNQDGTFKTQKLKKRLQNMQSAKLRREKYFAEQISTLKLDFIIVEWYVTFNKKTKDLPLNVEGTLLQLFMDKNMVLPIWNKQA
jgi:hypothetical protein